MSYLCDIVTTKHISVCCYFPNPLQPVAYLRFGTRWGGVLEVRHILRYSIHGQRAIARANIRHYPEGNFKAPFLDVI